MCDILIAILLEPFFSVIGAKEVRSRREVWFSTYCKLSCKYNWLECSPGLPIAPELSQAEALIKMQIDDRWRRTHGGRVTRGQNAMPRTERSMNDMTGECCTEWGIFTLVGNEYTSHICCLLIKTYIKTKTYLKMVNVYHKTKPSRNVIQSGIGA